MSDLIDRQAAIDALDEIRHALWEIDIPSPTVPEYVEHHEQVQSVWKLLDKKQKELYVLKSAHPEQRWIPVTERLPDTDNEVLVTVFDMEDDYVEVYKGFYQDNEWWTQWCHGCLRIKDEPCGANIVTAWMPLPEPYRKEGEAK